MVTLAIEIIPVPHALHASVRVPGSKSLTNRALLIAALAEGTTRLTNALFSDDSRYFAEALQALGFDVRLDPPHSPHFGSSKWGDARGAEMTVTGLGGHIPARKAELFIGNAGTAARFLSALRSRSVSAIRMSAARTSWTLKQVSSTSEDVMPA